MLKFSPNVEREIAHAGYSLEPVIGRQRRLAGRMALVPDFDIRSVKLSAGIDTVDIECFTNLAGACRHLRRKIIQDTRCRGVFVRRTPRAVQSGSIIIRFQNPNYKDMLDLQSLPYLLGPFSLREVHVALDFNVLSSDAARTAKMATLVHLIARHLYPPRTDLKSVRRSRGRGARNNIHLWRQIE